jgi:hypothetical protein
MISFNSFLAESKKQYSFRIKLACECSKEQLSKLKTGLTKYDLAAISDVKETPIAETHVDFDHFKNIKISIIDILTNYPANPAQIRELIRDHLGISTAHIMVTTPGEEANAMPVVPQEVLGKDYPVLKKPNLMADLAKALKDHKSIEYPFAGKSATATTTDDLPQGIMSPVGSKQNKIPNPKKQG